MAFHSDNTLISNRELLTELALVPFRAIGRVMVNLSQNSANAVALRDLASVSDDALAAKGLTRAGIVSRAFRHAAYTPRLTGLAHDARGPSRGCPCAACCRNS